MARRRRVPRPWYRTRAYRLTRTIVGTVALVVSGVCWAQDDEPTDPAGGPAEARGARTPRAPVYVHTPPPRSALPPTPPPRTASPAGRPPRAVPRKRAEPVRPTPARPVRPTPTKSVRPARPAAPRTLPPSPARTVTIRYLGIKAPVVALRLDRERRLPAPPDDAPELVGWYSAGPAPGGPGTAVVVGHRDTRTGPAVFAALEVIKPGHLVEVRRGDNRTAVYTVDAVKTYKKAGFPNETVYGHRNRPELRLITCGGAYDRRTGYASNVVVFAHLTATRGPTHKT